MKEIVNSADILLPGWKRWGSSPVGWAIAVSFVLLFVASSARHLLFQSGAFDLGYFDQAIYLISWGRPPIVSFWGFHFLGGHADWMVYPLALLYWIYPSVYWLFAVQAFALAIAALPTFYLARQAGLNVGTARTVAIAYLLYPLVFNLNLFDFHPEVMALPLFLTAVLLARQRRLIWFTVCVVAILGCRDALALTVAAMGVWLLLFEQRRWAGTISIGLGTAWFLIAIKLVIPAFRPAGVEATLRYAYLGDSVLDIAKNLFLRPDLILGRVFSLETVGYLLLVAVPLLWGLSWRCLAPLIAAVPQVVINVLSESPSQRDLVHQYSLPILPFLLLAVIATLVKRGEKGVGGEQPQRRGGAEGQRNFRWLGLVWSLVAFLALAKYGYFGSIYLDGLDNWGAAREAIALVDTKGSVLTTHNIVPHLTHRSHIRFTLADEAAPDPKQFDYVLLNVRHSGWRGTADFAQAIVRQLQTNPQFQLRFQKDQVFLFIKGTRE
jgi:uncharacterized membrane protein